MSKNVSLAGLVEEIKRHSSRWIKTLHPHYRQFAWQAGYAGFSVSQSVLKRSIKYIENQEIHHRKTTFEDEVRSFLNEYGVEYDERFIWVE
jgi:hypothetical protein